MTGVIAGLDRSDPTKPRARELAVDGQGRLVVVMSGEGAAGAGAPVDGSGTIAVGGTAQLLFGGTVPDAGYAIYNADPDNDLWINDGGGNAAIAGAGSIRIPANGGGYETPADMVPWASVSIVGAVTGQKFTARRW